MFNHDSIASVISIYGGALPAAFLMAVTFAIFGMFVVLKKMVFIGVTLSEVAACGVALALIYELPPFVGAALLCLFVVAILAYPYEHANLPRDTILGTIFIFASGMGILLVAHSGFGLEKVKAILYGNLLFASSADLITIAAVMLPSLLALFVFYRPILYSFLDRESSITLGINVWHYELLFFILLGLIVASASRIAGVMLVFCYLVIPAATALLLSRHLLAGMIIATIMAIVSTILGIMTSYQADLPPNQLIAVISSCMLVIAMFYRKCRSSFSRPGALVVAGTIFLALFLFLNSLHPAAEIASAADFSTLPLQEKPAVEIQPQTECNLPHDWATITENLEKALMNDKKDAVRNAVETLKSNPPPFFCTAIVEMIKQKTGRSFDWDYDLPANSEKNLQTLHKLAEELKL